jgi:hypothetical protein
MHLISEGEIGIFLALVGLAGAGAIMVAPEHIEIGWCLIALAVIGLISLGVHHFEKSMRSVAIVVISASIFSIGGYWYYWPGRSQRSIKQELATTTKSDSECKCHSFLHIRPSYLTGVYENRTEVQGDELASAYIGKCMKVTGTVLNIRNGLREGELIVVIRQ